MSETCPVCGEVAQPGESVCSACGFHLLGATQKFAPITPQQLDDATGAADSFKAGLLRVVRGPQPQVTFRLENRTMTIGRNPQQDIFLNDMTVSREHATIAPCEGGFVIRDESSYNGTWVNGSSVERCVLKLGDMIQIGAFCLLYEEA